MCSRDVIKSMNSVTQANSRLVKLRVENVCHDICGNSTVTTRSLIESTPPHMQVVNEDYSETDFLCS